jgi:hypothetical protein
MPRKPISAFLIFLGDLKNDQEFKQSLGGNNKMFIKEGSNRWSTLDPTLKETYHKRAQMMKE